MIVRIRYLSGMMIRMLIVPAPFAIAIKTSLVICGRRCSKGVIILEAKITQSHSDFV